jgi:hypothetical protein
MHELKTFSIHNERRLGAGRSGVVYQATDEHGRSIARKVFAAHDPASNVVHYVFSGAPNPYRWNEAAIRCAVLRRQIMAPLLRFWFGDRLQVANAYGHAWNAEESAWEVHCELVRGGHLPLRQPFSQATDLLSDLRHNVMSPLQDHLDEAGFDGLVWQAGRGNPVALNNFMLLPGEASNGNACGHWVWIDLESGVPALIPINPLDLLNFYLPRSFHHGRPLFDDTDIEKLREYVRGNHDGLEAKLGVESVAELSAHVDSLERYQDQWRAQPRYQRSIAYRHSRGFLSDEEVQHYNAHPSAWYFREGRRACGAIAGKLLRLPGKIAGALARIPLLRWITLSVSMLVSQAYRAKVAREYVVSRSGHWLQRGQLTQVENDALCEQMDSQEASSYLTDFGMHLAVKPFVKLIQFGIVPLLIAASLLTAEQGVVAVAIGGAAVRTIYTFLRILQNAVRGRERPWLALFVGMLPMVGNLAFPLQVVYSSGKQGALVAQFILFDSFARFGQIFPIWGGDDTLIEHLANRLPTRLPGVSSSA